jgi:hypothetical protein
MKYKIRFKGRTVGAIGITYRINTTVEAETPEAAQLKLYDKWDTITELEIKPIKKGRTTT